jgi:hypothetical protein
MHSQPFAVAHADRLLQQQATIKMNTALVGSATTLCCSQASLLTASAATSAAAVAS